MLRLHTQKCSPNANTHEILFYFQYNVFSFVKLFTHFLFQFEKEKKSNGRFQKELEKIISTEPEYEYDVI